MTENYTDLQVIAHALGMWRNHIETGNISMSKQDAINCNDAGKIKALDQNQQRFVSRLEQLQNKALTQDSAKRLKK